MNAKLKKELKEIHDFKMEYMLDGVCKEDRPKAKKKLEKIVKEFGGFVDCYPTWHPLVMPLVAQRKDADPCNSAPEKVYSHISAKHKEFTFLEDDNPANYNISANQNYHDAFTHTINLKHGFIAHPSEYISGGTQGLINFIKQLPSVFNKANTVSDRIYAEPIDVFLRNNKRTKPVIVYYDRSYEDEDGYEDKKIDIELAANLFTREISKWIGVGQVNERWDTIVEHAIGSPFSGTESAFVSKETGAMLRKIHNFFVKTELMGKGLK